MNEKKNAYIYEISWTVINFFTETFHSETFYTESQARSFIRELTLKKVNHFEMQRHHIFTGAIIAIRKVVEASDKSVEFTDEPVGSVFSMNR